MPKLIVPADKGQLDTVLDFVNKELEQADCPMKVQMQIGIAVEELFVNVASYAYGEETGQVQISCEIDSAGYAILQFEDSGSPYNPLEKEDPDVTKAAEEREIGGLGIFLVKKSMDELVYQYRDGKNILTIKKQLNL